MMDYKALIIIGVIVVALIVTAIGAAWLTSRQGLISPVSKVPYNLVTTFKGDAGTSRAFTWYTVNPAAAGWIELVKGPEAAFGEETVKRIQAVSTKIKTKNGSRGVHKVEVTGLEPGTLYSYRVGSSAEEEGLAASQFTTEDSTGGSTTFINVTDSQGEAETDFKLWGQTLNKAFLTFPEARFIIHNGDLTEDPKDAAAWDDFFGNVQERVSQIPLMPVTGNHDEVGGNANPYSSHFNLPVNGAKGSVDGTSYSFDYGSIHITVLNTESNLKNQADWLRKDLAGTDKPWKIVALHRPAYGGNTYKKLEDWTELFDKYGVDLVLQGHNHEYSRSCRLRAGAIVPESQDGADSKRGTVYVVINAAGAKFNEKKEDQYYHAVHFQNYKQMFAGITVAGDKLTYQAFDVDGEMLDEFVLRH